MPQDLPLWTADPLNRRDGRSTSLSPRIAGIGAFSSASSYYAGAVGPNGSSTMTIAALVRVVRASPGTVAGKHNGATKGYGLGVSATNEIEMFAFNGSGTRCASPSKALSERSFHHVVGVLDGSVARLFVDGVEVEGDRDQISSISAYSTGSFGVGARGSGASGATGVVVAGVAVLGSDALDAREISRWYDAVVAARGMVAPADGTLSAMWTTAGLDAAPASWTDTVAGAALARTGTPSFDLYAPRIGGALITDG